MRAWRLRLLVAESRITPTPNAVGKVPQRLTFSSFFLQAQRMAAFVMPVYQVTGRSRSYHAALEYAGVANLSRCESFMIARPMARYRCKPPLVSRCDLRQAGAFSLNRGDC